VLLLGDTFTVPFFCLAARRACVPIVHLEAGLRSFNPTSMEEVNRRVAGALASVHLAPTDLAARFLRDEGVADERIAVVGNPIIDVLRLSGRTPTPIDERVGVVLTAHRASNVDNPQRLAALVQLARRVADDVGRVVFPVHPRTRHRLDLAGLTGELEHPGISLQPPVPWEEMLDLLAACRVVVTDSGGLQEEASFFGVPVVVLRSSTPRWEGVAMGTSVLTGLDVERAVAAAIELSGADAQVRALNAPCPYGDGHTAERVAELLLAPHIADLLALDEPDMVDTHVPW
jgi:UDP-N-acetylglucosamine 2-epimerase (non-hydrolysing)